MIGSKGNASRDYIVNPAQDDQDCSGELLRDAQGSCSGCSGDSGESTEPRVSRV
jgi:hypothetical protein